MASSIAVGYGTSTGERPFDGSEKRSTLAGAAAAAGAASPPVTGPKEVYMPRLVQLACEPTKASMPLVARNSSFASTVMPERDGSCMKAQACATLIVAAPAATACILMFPPRDRQPDPCTAAAQSLAEASRRSKASFAPAPPSWKVEWMRIGLVSGDSLGNAWPPVNAVAVRAATEIILSKRRPARS